MHICPECNSGRIDESFGEYHCNSCGYDWSTGDYGEDDDDIDPSDLSYQMAQLERDELKNDLDELEEQITQCQWELNNFKNSEDFDDQSEFDSFLDSVESLRNTLDECQNRNSDNAIEISIEDFSDKIDNLEQELESLERDAEECKEKFQEHQEEHNDFKSNLDELSEKIAECSEKLYEIKNIGKFKEQIDELDNLLDLIDSLNEAAENLRFNNLI